MSKTGYQSVLTLYETQNAIGLIHQTFEEHLSQTLNLKRVSAPLFVDPSTGLNDNLNGVERPVSFEVPATGVTAEVVHSLAKWKRMALYRYDFRPGKGLYTNMNAIRRDEETDNVHSLFVDQWDWERIIDKEERNVDTLKAIGKTQYSGIEIHCTGHCDLHLRHTGSAEEKISSHQNRAVQRSYIYHFSGIGRQIS